MGTTTCQIQRFYPSTLVFSMSCVQNIFFIVQLTIGETCVLSNCLFKK